MLEHTTVMGRKATVAYIKKDFTPATKETAEMVKVIFEDGDVIFANVKQPDSDPDSGSSENGR
jgi:predicted SnoaL-like aldol condensation-catalyzing enzyme